MKGRRVVKRMKGRGGSGATSVLDPFEFYADPDPVKNINADPDAEHCAHD